MKRKLVSYKINVPAEFSFNECLWFLHRNLDDCMHEVSGNRVRKLLSLNQQLFLLEVRQEKDCIRIDLPLAAKPLPISFKESILKFVKEWFDMERDIAPFYKLLAKDKELRALGKAYFGLRLVGIPDLFELLCWCVIGQQINLQFAYKVKRRLVEKYGMRLLYDDQAYYVFPEPAVLATLTVDELRQLQLTTRKSEYIIGIAQLFVNGSLSKSILQKLKDEETMRRHLMDIRGIGEWTANYTVMKGLGGMNCVPYGDSGVNNALLKLKGIPKKNNRAEVEKVFAGFNGWKSYLVYYLWRYLRNPV